MRLILAANPRAALEFAREHNLNAQDVHIIRGSNSLEGLRFRYEDVVRVPGWSQNPDIEEIEDRILRTHVTVEPVKSENDLNYNEIAVGYTFEKDFEEWKRNQ